MKWSPNTTPHIFLFEISLCASVGNNKKLSPRTFRKSDFAKILRPKIKGIIDIIVKRIVILPYFLDDGN